MADYIDRQAAVAALREFAEDCKGSTEAATAASDSTVWQGCYQDGKYFEYILKEAMCNPPCWMPMPDEPEVKNEIR